MSDLGQKLDTFEPLMLGEMDVSRKRMQMLHNACHYLLETWLLGFGMAGQDDLRDRVLVDISHVVSNVRLLWLRI
ncbi:hypothetical protein PUN4_990012 [Paraburkholderia unamae]|nr:hypothetical protein PUN4_990012 [Paraburkholderia unamae]